MLNVFSFCFRFVPILLRNIQCVLMQKHKKIITKVIPLNDKKENGEQQQFDLILCMIESSEFYKYNKDVLKIDALYLSAHK